VAEKLTAGCQDRPGARVLLHVNRLIRPALVLGALLLLTAASPAGAAPRTVPPGHSGASQYTETLPTAGGEQATGEVAPATPAGGGAKGGGGGTGSGASGGGGATDAGEAGPAPAPTPTEALGARDAKRLEGLGPEGKAAANLAAAASPAASPSGHRSAAAKADASSPVRQVVGQLTGTSGSGGMGILLPLLIVASVLLAAAFAFTRRRPTEARH
jgi:hypothetical protein